MVPSGPVLLAFGARLQAAPRIAPGMLAELAFIFVWLLTNNLVMDGLMQN